MRAELHTVDVSAKTIWVFIRLIDEDGCEGVGEATLNNRTSDVLAVFADAAKAISDCPYGVGAKLSMLREAVSGVVGRVLASGFEQAWLDWQGKKVEAPVHALLGGAYRFEVPSYANINRGTLTRKPDEFGSRAMLALARGYPAIKLAPFDGVQPEAGDEARRAGLIESGFARIEAVVRAVGDAGRVQVDCHSRFRFDEAPRILDRLADLGVVWFEEPVLENPEAMPALVDLRARARARGVKLAGAEKAADAAEFLMFLNARCYDVVMPDIVLAGGPSEVVRIGHIASQLGMEVSLHNPCGPVMDMHSAHVAAALPSLHSLERQFDESPLYDELVTRAHGFEGGRYELSDAVGIGLELDWSSPNIVLRQQVPITF